MQRLEELVAEGEKSVCKVEFFWGFCGFMEDEF
jgi:hypothetical protein